ncbi:MAG: GGDEF domain-containing response regulator [Acidobacteria bacterium]|nr:GGDEF domain-containing response regulator [Acidobacteriota bacterium]
MNGTTIRTLVIDGSPGFATYLAEALAAVPGSRFELSCQATLADGLAALADGGADVVVLDLHLPDSEGLETLRRVLDLIPEVPVVVLSELDADDLGVGAVRQGAQDFLVKARVNGEVVARALRYAIERHHMIETLRSAAMIDDLTGLYNRRGLLTLAEHHVKLAQRSHRQLLLIFADLDDFKRINDSWGHAEGDLALIETAEALRGTFRGSDIIARLGGDEFVVVAVDPGGVSSDTVTARLRDNLHVFNAQAGRPYRLSLSIGTMRFEPSNSVSILELLARVDEAMYQEKRSRRRQLSG